jgi:hypothetical protein
VQESSFDSRTQFMWREVQRGRVEAHTPGVKWMIQKAVTLMIESGALT